MIVKQAEHYRCPSLSDTTRAGEQIAQSLKWPSCVYMQGNMGAGKTTLCQAIIKCLGYDGAVTSPTYNLIQEYQVTAGTIYHMDLYRVEDPSELEFLAIQDLWKSDSLFLIEWPEKGAAYLPQASDIINIQLVSSADVDIRLLSHSQCD